MVYFQVLYLLVLNMLEGRNFHVPLTIMPPGTNQVLSAGLMTGRVESSWPWPPQASSCRPAQLYAHLPTLAGVRRSRGCALRCSPGQHLFLPPQSPVHTLWVRKKLSGDGSSLRDLLNFDFNITDGELWSVEKLSRPKIIYHPGGPNCKWWYTWSMSTQWHHCRHKVCKRIHTGA